MKKLYFLIISMIITVSVIHAQTPQGINYQGMARDNSGNVLANQTVSLRFSVLSGSINGSAVYVETQTTTTDGFGLFLLMIGQGTVVSGTFTGINWGSNSYFLKAEMDAAGGTAYQYLGTSQFAAVPYALYAATSGTAQSANETDPVYVASPANGITGTNINNWNTAYGWGNHSGLYRPIGWLPAWLDITNKPNFATVATSGSYNDLNNKPTIDGSETKITAGTNVAITGIGTTGNPYIINGTSNSSQGVRIGFSSSTTWICPSNVTQITLELWGGGGGSGGSDPPWRWTNIYENTCILDNTTIYGIYFLPYYRGGCGGAGGKGGYAKAIISVIPGTLYNITIGNGGGGGNGCILNWTNINTGCPYIYHKAIKSSNASDGIDGQPSIFGNNLLVADYGRKGTAGNTGIGTITDGVDGANGTVIGCAYLGSQSFTRSYLPISYIPAQSNCYSNGGSKQMAIKSITCIDMIFASEGCDNYQGVNGESGENGTCIISY